MNQSWERVQSLFLEASELPPEERARFLHAACPDDAEVRCQVESLLAHDGGGEPQFAEAIEHTARSLVQAVALQTGTRVGDYEVVKLVGCGAMGEVYRARDWRLARDVAIKVLPAFVVKDAERLSRFEQEARAAAALNHPNILAVYQMGVYEGAPYMVSELLEGCTLRELMRRGPLPLRSAIDYGVQIARGLDAAHKKGIVHRDLKPENLFVTSDGHVKILDFGLAKLTRAGSRDQQHATEAGLVMGTVGYMSPEQVRGQPVDYRTDVFAFGAILFEMLTGRRAFQKSTAADTMIATLKEDPPDVSPLLAGTMPALQRVVRRCLEKNREQRFQSASDMAFALESLSDSGSMAVAEAPSRRARLWKAAVAIFALALIATGGLYYYLRQSKRLTEKDTTVLADFTNTTGDPVFDDALKTALAVSLRQSPFLNVLSDSKVEATLQLMARPANTPLTPAIAREVCERAGSKAYIAGSIAPLGSQYVLGLKGVNCRSGELLGEEQVTAASKEKVLDALGEAASRLRRELGESLATVQSFDVPLAEATTSSLEALKAFSLGQKAVREKGPAAALPYHQHAIELDPTFATGYNGVGSDYYSMSELGRARDYLAKAFQFRTHASEREQLDIASGYYEIVTGELEKAAGVYQQCIASYPRDQSAHLNLGNTYGSLGRYEKSITAFREAMRLDPDDLGTYANLANSLLALQRFDEARQTIEQAHERKLEGYLLHAALYAVAFNRRDAPAMAEEQQWLMGRPGESFGLSLASDTQAYAGQLADARKLTKQSVTSALQADSQETGAIWLENSALREAAFGNRTDAQQAATDGVKLAPESPGASAEAALAFAMAGDSARAESLAQELNKRFPLDTQIQSLWLPAIRAQVALNRKNPSLAVSALQAVTPLELAQFQFLANLSCLYPTYIRGQAYLAEGQGGPAAVEFQKILDHGGIVWNCWTGALARLGVARANAFLAKNAKPAEMEAARVRALAAYKDFLSLWKAADPDIPIYKEAKAEYAKLL
jgi:serine/threonine protein kinase/tetratricopeptide (TPR) repeat protein